MENTVFQQPVRTPEDYADTFQVLTEQGAFDKEFCRTLKEMARFRNRLIHLYWEVNDENIYEILRTRLGDFKKYLDDMAVFLHLENL